MVASCANLIVDGKPKSEICCAIISGDVSFGLYLTVASFFSKDTLKRIQHTFNISYDFVGIESKIISFLIFIF